MTTSKSGKPLSEAEKEELFHALRERFEKNMKRHEGRAWATVQAKLEAHPEALTSLREMEQTGGEPDVVHLEGKSDEIIFVDCSPESPKGRRSLCYDLE